MRAKLSQLFSDFNHASHPSVQAAPTPLGPLADASTRDELLRAHTCVDGLAAPGPGHPGAASHTSQWPIASHPSQWPIDWGAVRDEIAAARALPEAVADGMRDELADIRALAEALVHTAMDLVARIDRIDPTPGALAAVENEHSRAVADLDAYRR
ncbi:hypothetical protein C5U48_12785 [Mycolicibacter virginiensis]|uniref:DUF4254 domain-containing protein n=2 Tax=Mycolicibacter virginiensis TaxID=1795032 RepID=A0A9X7IM56_9MYCO|nr:hypothetical protein C5U48_12785 [Mycolicibacter virginiensis]